MRIRKTLFAIGMTCGLSCNLGAEAPSEVNVLFGARDSLELQEPGPVAGETMCTGDPRDESTECGSQYRAVISAQYRRVAVRGTWL